MDVLNAYPLINEAKLTKLEDEAKFKVIKACKEMKPIVVELQEFEKDARKKLEGENHEDIINKAQKWQQEGDASDLSLEDKKIINQYLATYSNKISECLKDELNKSLEFTYEKLTKDELRKFIASNDWTVDQAIAVMSAFE